MSRFASLVVLFVVGFVLLVVSQSEGAIIPQGIWPASISSSTLEMFSESGGDDCSEAITSHPDIENYLNYKPVIACPPPSTFDPYCSGTEFYSELVQIAEQEWQEAMHNCCKQYANDPEARAQCEEAAEVAFAIAVSGAQQDLHDYMVAKCCQTPPVNPVNP